MHFLQLPAPSSWEKYIPYLLVAIGLIAFFVIERYRSAQRQKEREQSTNSFSSVKRVSVQETLVEEEQSDPTIRVSEKFDIPTWRIKFAFGLPLETTCDATTAEQAEDAFRNDTGDDSEEELAALLKWIELETDIERMSDIKKWTKGNLYARTLLLEKWNTLALKEVAAASTEDELLTAFWNCSEGSEAENECIRKMHALYTKELTL